MTKQNKIRIKATAGLKDLDQLHNTLKSFGMVKNYSLTQVGDSQS